MSRETPTADARLAGDLAILAGQERARLGDPPRAEQLIALIEGRLPEDQAEDLRDRLAVDPELATLYLDLKRTLRSPEPRTAELVPESEIDEAWRAVSTALARDAGRSPEEPGQPVAFRRRKAPRIVLAVAAAVLLSLGLIWLLAGRDGSAPLPEGKYRVVAVTGGIYRAARLPIPGDVVGLEMRIDARDLSGAVVVEVRDASGSAVRRQETTVRPGQREVVFRVASSSLEEGRAYRLSVRPSGAAPGDRALLEMVFRPVLEDRDE